MRRAGAQRTTLVVLSGYRCGITRPQSVFHLRLPVGFSRACFRDNQLLARIPHEHAGDRCDNDPQLKTLEWLTEVTGTKIGRWPIAEVPIKMSESPAYIGGRLDRGAPCYGEDNDYVYGELLGMSSGEISALAEEGVI